MIKFSVIFHVFAFLVPYRDVSNHGPPTLLGRLSIGGLLSRLYAHSRRSLKDTTTFEKAKHTQTMAAAKVAIRAFKDCLHEEELKRITDPIPA